ncbi:MAG: M17 family peptidase N-terminal domain-containing protein, partial [Candidatus Bathyanammoxibius sp.]
MQVTARQGTLIKERAEITVLGIFDAPQLEPTTKEFDRALGGMISRLKKNGDFRPKLNNTFLL